MFVSVCVCVCYAHLNSLQVMRWIAASCSLEDCPSHHLFTD